MSVDGKGSLADILFNGPIEVMKNLICWILSLLLFSLVEMGKIEYAEKKRNECFLLVAISFFLFLTNEIKLQKIIQYLNGYFVSIKVVILLLFSFVFCLSIFWWLTKKKYQINNIFYKIVFLLVLFFCVIYSDILYMEIYESDIFKYISKLFNMLIYYTQILLCVKIWKRKIIGKDKIEHDDAYLMILFGGIALGYSAIMAAGSSTVPSLAMRISTPFILAWLLDIECLKNGYFSIFKKVFISICIMFITTCIAQKSVTPYPWWGMQDHARTEKRYQINIKSMHGLYLTEEEKEMYENISSLIVNNSSEEDIIFGFPYIKIYNILCNRYNSYFVPVVWYDVVSDKYVNRTIEEIEENPPQIVVWYDIEGALEAHEAIYRNGKLLEQRKIIDYFDNVLDTDYELLGEYSEVRVYKRK